MSFREKSAWITLISILLVSAVYALHMPWTALTPQASPWILHPVGVCIIVFLVIEVTAHIVLYLRFPKEARTPKDERERLIDLKAVRLAASFYVILSFAAIFTIHFGANGIAVAYLVLLAFVIAEVVNYVTRIIYYRRGV